MEPLISKIESAGSVDWGNSAFGTGCMDCYVTLLRIQLRDPGGLISTFFVYWDDSTRGRISADPSPVKS